MTNQFSEPVGRVFTYDEIREWVLWARRRQMISGPDVAEFLGISPSRVNEIERGEKPRMLPQTRRDISKRILSEQPSWQPSKRSFAPLQSQEEVAQTVDHDEAMQDMDVVDDSVYEPEDTVPRPRISGQMIAIEVDQDDIFEITIQVRRKKES